MTFAFNNFVIRRPGCAHNSLNNTIFAGRETGISALRA